MIIDGQDMDGAPFSADPARSSARSPVRSPVRAAAVRPRPLTEVEGTAQGMSAGKALLAHRMRAWQDDHIAWEALAEALAPSASRNGLHLDASLHQALDLCRGHLIVHLREEHALLFPRLEAEGPAGAVLLEDVQVDHAVLRNAAHAFVHFVATNQDPRRAFRAVLAGLTAHARLHERVAQAIV